MRYRTVPGVVATSVCDRYFLVTTGGVVRINEMAAFYWGRLGTGADEEELAALAEEEYEGVDREAARADVRDLLEALSARRLIVRCGK